MRRSRHVVALAAVACLLPACTDPVGLTGPDTDVVNEFRADGFLFTATVRQIIGNSIEVTLTVTNETDARAQTSILGGNCMLRPRVYTSRGGSLLWSHWNSVNTACQEPLRVFDLEGGGTESIVQSFTVVLQNGTNFVTVTIQHGTDEVELAAGTISAS